VKTLVLMTLLLLSGDEDFAAGTRAYAEGRYPEALEAFTRAEFRAGNGASAELLHNRALAALATGDLRVAEFCAEKAAVRGGPEFAGLREFLFGNAAYARCERAESESALMEADPTALGQAIVHAQTALLYWRMAATSREDWPSARRNVERAILKLEELRKKKEEADKNPKTRQDNPQPDPESQEDPDRNNEEVEEDPDAQELDPSASQLTDLLDLLAKKEAEKRDLRRARQRARSADVERDW
jgi:hypothetical protein